MPDKKEELQKSIEAVLTNAEEPSAAKNTLALLFPKLESVLKTYLPSEGIDVRERARRHRIASKDYASAYFALDAREASWRISEIDQFLDSGPFEGFSRAVTRIRRAQPEDQPELRRVLLESLDDAFAESRPFTSEWMRAIVRFSPEFIRAADEHSELFFRLSNLDRLRRAVVRALRPLSEIRRAQIVLDAISDAQDLTLLSEVVRSMAGDTHPEGAKESSPSDAFGELTFTVRDRLIDRVRAAAADGTIWENGEAGRIIWFWWGSNLENEVREFTAREMDSEVGLNSLLQITIGNVISTAGNYEHVSRRNWSHVVDLDSLSERAKKIAEGDDLNRKLLADRFLKALQRFDEE